MRRMVGAHARSLPSEAKRCMQIASAEAYKAEVGLPPEVAAQAQVIKGDCCLARRLPMLMSSAIVTSSCMAPELTLFGSVP